MVAKTWQALLSDGTGVLLVYLLDPPSFPIWLGSGQLFLSIIPLSASYIQRQDESGYIVERQGFSPAFFAELP